MPYQTELLESDQGQSYDIASELDYISHRRRSNTAQRLHRLTEEKKHQSHTRNIVWRCSSTDQISTEEKQDDGQSTTVKSKNSSSSSKSEENNIPRSKSKSPPTKSGLTKLLEKFPSLPKNPFDGYAQYDGGMSESMPVKKIMIFIALSNQQQANNNNMQPTNCEMVDQNNKLLQSELQSQSSHTNSHNQSQKQPQTNHNNPQTLPKLNTSDTSDKSKIISPKRALETKPNKSGPLEVVVISSARIRDLIGLICWQYTNEGREPKLSYDIDRYCLRIAEDNGEVDPDFPSLNPNEQLSKFNFPMLAFAERPDERLRNFNDQYPNGSIYNPRIPNYVQSVVTKSNKPKVGKLSTLTRIIFRDAKLETEQ